MFFWKKKSKPEIIKDDFFIEVEKIVDEVVSPYVKSDGGNIKLTKIINGIAYVRMSGACKNCPAIGLTLKGGVEKVLVDATQGRISKVELEI